MSTITRIDITHHQLPLDPPFPASWDPQPRTRFPATIVRIHDDEGRMGIGSGDAMYGFIDYQRYFIGQDPLDLDRHAAVLANIEFHAGRPWPLDVAVVGSRRQDHRPTDLGRWLVAATIVSAPTPRAACTAPSMRWSTSLAAASTLGFPALKVRFGRASLDDDLAVIKAVRDAVGSALELMVDCNQGWRMPWDTAAPWHRRNGHRRCRIARRRARVLDGRAAPSRRLRRHDRVAAPSRRAHRRWRVDSRAI